MSELEVNPNHVTNFQRRQKFLAQVVRVVDGDTVDVDLHIGGTIVPLIVPKQRVRLLGLDTPESRTRDLREKKFGYMAKKRLEELMPVDVFVVIVTDGRGKFGRILGDFQTDEVDSVVQTLIQERLGVAYEGQSKDDIRAQHEANWAALEKRYPSSISVFPRKQGGE